MFKEYEEIVNALFLNSLNKATPVIMYNICWDNIYKYINTKDYKKCFDSMYFLKNNGYAEEINKIVQHLDRFEKVSWTKWVHRQLYGPYKGNYKGFVKK